jgi:hypothetical protein
MIEEYSEKGYDVERETPVSKDFNDDLINLHEEEMEEEMEF